MKKQFSLLRVFAYSIVLIALIFSLSRFWPLEGASRHIDTRWLLAASSCLLEGSSPYAPRLFELCWQNSVEEGYLAPFVFGPPVLLFIWPLDLFDKSLAFTIFDIISSIALVLLAVVLLRISKLRTASGISAIVRSVWVAFGISIGGIAGSAYVGQPVILVALGVALIYLASEVPTKMSFVAGSFLCLIKPHLTILPLVLCWLSNRVSLRERLIAFVVIAALIAYLLWLDPFLLSNYRESLEIHSSSAAALISEPKNLFGVPGLMDRLGYPAIATVFCCAFVSLLIGVWFARNSQSFTSSEMLFCSLLLGGMFFFPIKDYDLGVLAILFALASKKPWTMQAFLALPLLILWRPSLVMGLGLTSTDNLTLVTLVGLCLAAFYLGLALESWARERRSSFGSGDRQQQAADQRGR